MSDLPSVEQERWAAFAQHLTDQGRSPRTVQGYRGDYAHFARWYVQSTGEVLDVGRLASVDVVQYKSWLQTVRAAQPATINRRLAALKRYVRFAESQGWIAAAIAARIQAVEPASRTALAPRGLTQPEVRALLRQVELGGEVRDVALVYLLLYAGLRVGELTQLRRDDVELKPRSGQVRIRAATAKRRRERTVPLPLAARKALADYLEARSNLDDECLFLGQRGPLTPAGVRHLLRQYGRQAGLTALGPHALRHTFAYTYLAQNPGDLVGLAQILGHADVRTTAIYGQKRLADLAAGMERVNFYDV